MQTLQTTSALPFPHARTPPCAASLVVISAIDELWTDAGHLVARDAAFAVDWLLARGVPLVLTTRRAAADTLALQRALDVRHPFVCDGGAALYVPAGYFPELTRIGSSIDGWNIVEFRAPHDTGAAVRLLLSLYRLCSDQVVMVGVGQTWDDHVLLRDADVAVVLRSGSTDEARLLAATPSAYLTNARGPAGWSEAILGPLAE